jgi:hypothetical protein
MQIVVVDGFGPGEALACALHRRGAGALHLQSEPTLVQRIDSARQLYDADFGYVGDAAIATGLLSDVAPDGVVAATSPGVEFAETAARGPRFADKQPGLGPAPEALAQRAPAGRIDHRPANAHQFGQL